MDACRTLDREPGVRFVPEGAISVTYQQLQLVWLT
jgi:hypothetical protein